jgi:hypothetical protein
MGGLSETPRFSSKAHWTLALLICRMLLTQVLMQVVFRYRVHPGTAIADRKAMMATTIIISTRVNPRRVRRICPLRGLSLPALRQGFALFITFYAQLRQEIGSWKNISRLPAILRFQSAPIGLRTRS